MSVWQKVAPLAVLIIFIRGVLKGLLIWTGCVGRVVGGVGGICQTQVRSLLGYSSITHNGWLIVGGIIRVVGAVLYFVIYGLINCFLFYYLYVVEVRNYCSLLKNFSGVRVKQLLVLRLLLMRLAGLPPTVGFSMKWAVILVAASYSIFVVGILMVGSVLRLYYYSCLRFCWCCFGYSKVWEFVGSIKKVYGGYLVGVVVVCGFVRFLAVSLILL